MSKATIREYLPKTNAYVISDAVSSLSTDRAGHHIYCIKQRILNTTIAICDMTQSQLDSFDDDSIAYLKRLDVPLDQR